MKKIVIIFFSLFLIFACKKNCGNNENKVHGKLRNYTGFDGCGWVIELNEKDANGAEVLEPVNLKDFKVDLEDGEEVVFSYVEAGNMSVCMVGPTIKLTSIKDKD